MKKIDIPDIRYSNLLTDCYSSYKNRQLIDRFSKSMAILENHTYDYTLSMEKREISKFKNLQDNFEIVNGREMITLYEKKMVKSKNGRKYYDQIMALAPNGTCALCGVREATTLDHFLEKSKFRYLSVSPTNLVPACKDCNFGKKVIKTDSYENFHLNPYYDHDSIDVQMIWLKADIRLISNSIISSFRVEKPNEMCESMYKKILNHFQMFNLNNAYSFNATDEIDSNLYYFKKLLKEGEEYLLHHISGLLDSAAFVSLNSWKTALYRGLLEHNNLRDLIEQKKV